MGNPAQPGQGFMSLTNPVLGDLGNQTGSEFLSKFISGLIQLVFVVGSVIFFFMLVMGAIQWISSGGDKQALEGAKGKITNAIIGIVILLAIFAITKIIETFFGISILTLDLAPLVIQ